MQLKCPKKDRQAILIGRNEKVKISEMFCTNSCIQQIVVSLELMLLGANI